MVSSKCIKKRIWLTFNKEGFGGLSVVAKTEKKAIKLAREQWGKGAQVEDQGMKEICIVKNR